MATVPRLQRYYQSATTSCSRMSFGLLISPAGSAGVCRGSCSPRRSRRHADLTTGRGLDCSRWPSPFQRSCPRARAGSPRFPGGPSRDFAPVHDPGRPVAPRQYRRFRCCPHTINNEGVIIYDFEAARRFITCCLRFTTGVAARHARLASGWRAAPLPGGSRTRWIATRGFSSWHPPLQSLAWRNNRSLRPWRDDLLDGRPSREAGG